VIGYLILQSLEISIENMALSRGIVSSLSTGSTPHSPEVSTSRARLRFG
jgi:hypothetical protein